MFSRCGIPGAVCVWEHPCPERIQQGMERGLLSAWPPFPACELRGLTAAGVPAGVRHWVAWDDGNVRSDKVSGKASKQTSLFSGLLGLELVLWC